MTGWTLGRRGGLTLALAAVAAGLVILVVVWRAQESAPQPHPAGRIHPRSATTPTSQDPTTPSSGTSSSGTPSDQPSEAPPLGPSRPVSLKIPAIGVDTEVFSLGLADDGTLAVPQPGPHLNDAAWFENSPSPGQPGPAIIEGHVDSVEGPSVFFKLGAIKPGDKLVVTRRDGRVTTFKVDAVRDFLKAKFPTNLVFGGNAEQNALPTLRLITCSDFDSSIGHHIGNEVVFAHLVHVSST